MLNLQPYRGLARCLCVARAAFFSAIPRRASAVNLKVPVL